MITIYDKDGTAKLTVPISDKGIYHKGIMEEEYVSLIFNHDEAIRLRNADYIDTEYGRFEIVELADADDKTSSSGGYAFEQRFNPRWWRGSLFKLFYNRQAGYEASWKMTHYASYFMEIVVDNLKRAGIGEYTYEIGDDVSGMQFIQFDGVSIIDGLTLIAEAWETEWWFADNVIHLGRCEFGDPVKLGAWAELASIKHENSADTEYATRLYVFGSTRNVPNNYRKSLVFTVNSIKNSGNIISDTTRPLIPEWFPKSLQAEGSYDTKNFVLGTRELYSESYYVQAGNDRSVISYPSMWIGALAPRKYILDLSALQITCKWGKLFAGSISEIYVKATIKGSGGTCASYTKPVTSEKIDISTEGETYAIDGMTIPFTIDTFINASFALDIVVKSAESNDFAIQCSCMGGNISLSSEEKVYQIAGLTLETVEDSPQKIEGVIFNPYYNTTEYGANWLKLPDGVTLPVGTKYKISPIYKSLVDSGHFLSSEDEVINNLIENRLALPADCDPPYIDAWENLADEDVVEAIVTTDSIYPRRTGTIDSVSTKQYTDTIENEDGTSTEKVWNAFRFTDAGITFSEDYCLAGEELRIIFQSGKLAGMDFAVTFNPDAVSDEMSVVAQVWEIVRNEDYGTALPTDDFCPEAGDTYILYGYDTTFVGDNLVDDAEQELLEFGIQKAKKLSADKANYNCVTNAVRCAGYTADDNGVMRYNESDVIDLDIGAKVELEHPVYFPDGAHVSRVRSFERSMVNRYDCTYTVGETKSYSRTGELADKIDAIEYRAKQDESAAKGTGSATATSVYIIKRNDSTTPSDHNVFSALRSRLEFMCREVAEYVRTCWTFLKGLNIGLYVSGETGARIDESGNAEFGGMTARKDVAVGGNITAKGDATAKQLTATDHIVAPRFSTPDYRSGGLSGEGAAVYSDDEGLTHAEFDLIIARRGLTLTTLTIEEVRSVGGGFVASKGDAEVEKVETYYGDAGDLRYVIRLKDVNKFVVNDLVRYARYDHTNNSYRWAWVPVRGCDTANRIINLWETDFTDGMTVPQQGDILVQMGNAADTSRQGFVYITPEGVQCFDGVNSPSLVGKCRGVFGDLSGITDGGKALSGFGVWTDNLYIGTGKTAYETFAELYNSIAATDSTLAIYQTEVNSRFDVVDGALLSVQKSVTSLQSGGGRNLLLQTNQGVAGWFFTNGNVGDVEISERTESNAKGVLFLYNETATPSWEVIMFQLRPEKIVSGATYTLSFDVMELNSAGGVTMKLDICDTAAKNSLLSSRAAFPQATIAEEWVTFSVSFTASASGTATGAQRIYLAIDSAYNGAWNGLTFRNLKLEEGEVATAYSPAPEDYVDSELSAVRSSITAIEQTTDSISARVEEVNTSLNGKISSNTSKITQNSSAITTEVTARTEGDAALASSIEQTASNISLKLSQMALSNINHAYGTETPFVMTSGFANIANQTVKLFDVTGLATGDKVSLSYTVRIKGIVWDENAFINTQFSTMYGWVGGNLRITGQYLIDNGIEADEEGYYTIHCQATGITIGKNYTGGSDAVVDAVPSDVGYVYMRLDYISADETTGAVIEVSKLKVEIGTAVTEWTARTGDLEDALIDTGINISEKKITVTANQFEVRNNNGDVTASVDNAGRLTSNTFIAKEGTYKRTTINENFNGFGRWYYPDSDIPCIEIGWDESQSSFIRVYDKDGNMAWKLDTSLAFNNPTNNVWAEKELYSLGLDYDGAVTMVKIPGALTMQTYYSINRAGRTRVYTEIREDFDYTTYGITGYFTDMSDAKLADVPESNKYYRRLYYYEAGEVVSLTEIIFLCNY